MHDEEEKKLNAKQEVESSDEGRLETIVEEPGKYLTFTFLLNKNNWVIIAESQASTDQINSVEEIVELLPKVWRVLIELLSHHKVPTNNINEDFTEDNPCYKTVQTPKGIFFSSIIQHG